MSIQRAEKLKRQWTDQFVQVRSGFPELKRFAGLTGKVRTVNMNCRLLVEFDAPADISWYDIDPDCVEQVDPPADQHTARTSATAQAKSTNSSTADKPAAAPASAATGRAVSPLDQIRQQNAKPESRSVPAAAQSDTKQQSATTASEAGNPLDQIRAQSAGAATASSTGPSKRPAEQKNRSAGGAAAAAAKASPLDQIRAQAGTSTAPQPAQPATPQSTTEQPAADAAHAEPPTKAESADEASGSASAAAPPAAAEAAPAARYVSQAADARFRPSDLPANVSAGVSMLADSTDAATEGTLPALQQIRQQAGVTSSAGTAFEQFRRQAED